MTDADLQVLRDRYSELDPDRTRLCNGLDVAVTDIDALLAEVDALKAQLEDREADIYTAGYDAGEEAAARDIKQLKAQLDALKAEDSAAVGSILATFYAEVCAEALRTIAASNMVSGAHWNAMLTVLKRRGVTT